jgi:hypothetical protein
MIRLMTQKIRNASDTIDIIRIIKCPSCNVPIIIKSSKITNCSICTEEVNGADMIALSVSIYFRLQWHLGKENK